MLAEESSSIIDFLLQPKILIVAQTVAIVVLTVIILILALSNPEELVAARTQALLHSQEQQNRTALAQLELVWTRGEQERRNLVDTLNQRIDKLEANNQALSKQLTAMTERQSQELANVSKSTAELEQRLVQEQVALSKILTSSNKAYEQQVATIQAGLKQLEQVSEANRAAQNTQLKQLAQDLVDMDRRLEAREVALIRGSRLLDRMQDSVQPPAIPKVVPSQSQGTNNKK